MTAGPILFVIAAAAVTTREPVLHAQKGGTSESRKVLAQRFHLDMIQKGNLDIADEIIAPDCVIHLPGGTSDAKGPERAKQIADPPT